MVRTKVCPLLYFHSDSSDVGSTVIITSDLRRIIDNVNAVSFAYTKRYSLTPFAGAQVHSRQRPPCWLLPLRK